MREDQEEVREDQEHLAACTGYADFRAGRDLTKDDELVGFVTRGMARRKERAGISEEIFW